VTVDSLLEANRSASIFIEPGEYGSLRTEQERHQAKRLLLLALQQIPFDLRCIIATSF